jgi:hypothetical protein
VDRAAEQAEGADDVAAGPARRRLIAAALRAELPLIEWQGLNHTWTLNTYQSCDVRCRYCITRTQGVSEPREPRATVARRLGEELDALGEVDHVSVGPYVDVYPSTEAALGVTRAALEVLAERDIRAHLITKGPTVVRDADLLARPGVEVQISIPSFDAEGLARIELGAADPAARLAALEVLHRCGVQVRLQVSPWIPGLSDVDAARRAVDPSIPITTSPLRLPPYLDGVGRSLGLTQPEINEAFRKEYERVGRQPNVWWSLPPALDGAAPHIDDNVGRRERDTWDPAPAGVPAPRPDGR